MRTSDFKTAYVTLITHAWSDETYRRAVLADPVPVLREAGFDLPDGAHVRIDEQEFGDHAEQGLDVAADYWNRGYTHGDFRLVLPPRSPVELAELPEEELAGLAGGVCCSCCCSSAA